MLRSRLRPGAAIALSAVGIGIATALGRLDAPAPVMASAASGPVPTPAQSAPELDVRELKRERNPAEVTDLFAPRKPRVAVVPAPANSEPAPQAPPPSAPPLPFIYLGKLVDGDKLEIFVARGEDHYSVEKGKTIDSRYRVEKVTASAVTFIYLPLGTRQTLPIPAPPQ
jgi:hypothetical protein